VTYSNVGPANNLFFNWLEDGSNFMQHILETDGVGTIGGRPAFRQQASGVNDIVRGDNNAYSPGVNVGFNLAGRHGSTFVNGAVDGTALTADTTPTALPDLSAADMDLAFTYLGTVRKFRMWGTDLGDSGIEEASS